MSFEKLNNLFAQNQVLSYSVESIPESSNVILGINTRNGNTLYFRVRYDPVSRQIFPPEISKPVTGGDKNYWDLLPTEILIPTALRLSLGEINNICRTSLRFNEDVCASDYFWEQKYLQDFSDIREENREHYMRESFRTM